jgi:hypothetical protein
MIVSMSYLFYGSELVQLTAYGESSEAGVIDEPHSAKPAQLSRLPARQATLDRHGSSLGRMAGLQGKSAERG